MNLTLKTLAGMLASAVQPAAEQVVAIKHLRHSARFKKDEWRLFPTLLIWCWPSPISDAVIIVDVMSFSTCVAVAAALGSIPGN